MTVHGLNALVDRERGLNGRFYYLNHVLHHVVYITNEREGFKSSPISCWSYDVGTTKYLVFKYCATAISVT
jgi:hypothetical protein